MGFCGTIPADPQIPPYLSPCQTYPIASVLLLLVATIMGLLQISTLRALSHLHHPLQATVTTVSKVIRGAAFLALLVSHAAALTQALVLGGAAPYLIMYHSTLAAVWLITLVRSWPSIHIH